LNKTAISLRKTVKTPVHIGLLYPFYLLLNAEYLLQVIKQADAILLIRFH